MNSASGAALAALLLFSTSGCSSHKADTETAATAETTASTATAAPATDGTSTAVAASASNDSDEKTGTGHVSITGQYALDHDFTVAACQTAPPGDGLLSGYSMQAKDGEAPFALLAVKLKQYDKDGSYDIPPTSREAAVGQAMQSGVMGPLTMMVLRDAAAPLGFMQVPSSKLTITVSNDGANGNARFTDLESQPSMEDIDPQSGGPPHGKRVSGTVTWTCGSVGRINEKMNAAVNGMFNKLIPPK